MHPTRTGSSLAALQDLPRGEARTVDSWTRECLAQCQRLHALSGGVFDPGQREVPDRFEDVYLLPEGGVTLRARVHLDLGGIAKVFAADRLV
jgi:thiamine biosynthesis lipoprotein ApbE